MTFIEATNNHQTERWLKLWTADPALVFYIKPTGECCDINGDPPHFYMSDFHRDDWLTEVVASVELDLEPADA